MNSRDPPSRILLLIISYLPQSFPLTNDYLFEIFKQYGEVRKILIFERGKTNKAFVEYEEVKHAIQARRNMIGKSLTPQGGRVLIHFSRLKHLDLEVVDHTRGSEYRFEDVENQPEPKQNHNTMTLPKAPQVSQPLIKPQSIENSQNDNIPVPVQVVKEESPSKGIMETQLRTLERILDDDYELEVAKIQQNFADQNDLLIQEILNQQPSKFLKITNINEKVTPRMLYNLFNRFGHLESVLLKKKYREAVLQFINKEHAIIAKELLNNIVFFGNELRILFINGNNSNLLQSANMNEEFYSGSQMRFKIVPLTKNLLFSGIPQLLEIYDMVKLVGKIQETKLEQNSILITMIDIFEALKVISVFSEYEYKGNKISLTLK